MITIITNIFTTAGLLFSDISTSHLLHVLGTSFIAPSSALPYPWKAANSTQAVNESLEAILPVRLSEDFRLWVLLSRAVLCSALSFEFVSGGHHEFELLSNLSVELERAFTFGILRRQ